MAEKRNENCFHVDGSEKWIIIWANLMSILGSCSSVHTNTVFWHSGASKFHDFAAAAKAKQLENQFRRYVTSELSTKLIVRGFIFTEGRSD